MSGAQWLLALALGLPALLWLACLASGARRRMPGLLPFAPLPALAAALFAADGTTFALGSPRLSLAFALDRPAAILLGVGALLWMAGGVYASRALRDDARNGRFVAAWLMTLTGCVGVYLAADLVGFYFLLAVLSIGASALVAHAQTPEAWRAGAVYLGLALFAEALLLGGIVLLAAAIPGESLLIRDGAAALAGSPWRDLTLALLIAGFAIKAGALPLHFWMPWAYPAAPTPAAAVLSGAVVKASLLGLLRFLPFELALPAAGGALVALGLVGAYYGVLIGITQRDPKAVLAYSSVSQMGFLLALVGAGLASGAGDTPLLAAFYAAHHLLVKGALFLAVGVAAVTGARRFAAVRIPATVIALGLGGLPLTGGALAKAVVKAPFGDGAAALLATLSAAGTTLLMVHFLRRLHAGAAHEPEASAPGALAFAWLALAAASLVAPWALYLALPLGSLPQALAPAELWKTLWPVVLGIALAFALARAHLPRVPSGDLGALLGGASRAAAASGAHVERFDTLLRQWPVAGISLLALCLVFWAAL